VGTLQELCIKIDLFGSACPLKTCSINELFIDNISEVGGPVDDYWGFIWGHFMSCKIRVLTHLSAKKRIGCNPKTYTLLLKQSRHRRH
jgi:hypothetical protein